MRHNCSKKIESEVILSMVRNARKDFPRMGAYKLLLYLRLKLKEMNIEIGRDAFALLLSENNMLLRRYRSKRKTTFSRHWMRKYPNLIRELVPTAPNQLWVSDIEVSYGFIYLSLITDAYSRKIVGWNLARSLSADNALKALKQALKALPSGTSLIHYSDRGIQYCSSQYVKELNEHNILISMTENGDPLENAIAERVNGILKTEWFSKYPLESWNEAVSYTEKIVELYNCKRPHQSMSYLTPDRNR